MFHLTGIWTLQSISFRLELPKRADPRKEVEQCNKATTASRLAATTYCIIYRPADNHQQLLLLSITEGAEGPRQHMTQGVLLLE